MRTTSRFRVLTAATAVAFTVAACGGGGGGDDDSGIASLSAGDDAASAEASSDATEEELLAWVECMRGQGLDIPDPTVDADGNLVLGGGPRGAAPGGAAEGDDTGQEDTEQDGTETGAAPDREAFAAASEECGDPPSGAVGGFDRGDASEFQDAALQFAQCMRDLGYDVDDPDFSNFGPGADGGATGDDTGDTGDTGDSGDSGTGGAAGPGGFLGDLDMDDPQVQTDVEACQQSSFGDLDLPGGGPGGAPAGGGD